MSDFKELVNKKENYKSTFSTKAYIWLRCKCRTVGYWADGCVSYLRVRRFSLTGTVGKSLSRRKVKKIPSLPPGSCFQMSSKMVIC